MDYNDIEKSIEKYKFYLLYTGIAAILDLFVFSQNWIELLQH